MTCNHEPVICICRFNEQENRIEDLRIKLMKVNLEMAMVAKILERWPSG